MMTRRKMERAGFKFVWGNSAYSVCVHTPSRTHLGTYRTRLAFSVPFEALEDAERWMKADEDGEDDWNDE